jgi:tetratricopeptide (TPR) repeat protein
VSSDDTSGSDGTNDEPGGTTDETDGTYDSFLREAARVTDGVPRIATAMLHPGARLLGDRFEIERMLGSGGMGVVYAARDHHRQCQVALKTLRAATRTAQRRLHDEFLVLQDLAHHPNLVSLGELFDDDGLWFFSMELVDGVDFLRHVRPEGVLDLARLRGAMAQLAAGLGFLHAAGIAHRDIKPSNVLCTGDRLVVLDFGLASGGGDTARVGTLPYMAPEQHDGEIADGRGADWYAVGVMLWAALAGRLPFNGSDVEMVAAKRAGPPPVDGPDDLAALAMALLTPDPAARPAEDDLMQRLGTPVSPRAPAMPFVGRGDELAALRAAWQAAQGQPGTALIRGPSGVGKSALLARFADELRGAGATVLIGRCHERVAMPYKAMHGIAAALVAHLRDDAAALAAASEARDVGLLPAVFPSLVAIDALARAAHAAPVIRDPQQRRARVFAAFDALITALAGCAPLALMIDDLQWADRDGLALLQHIAASAPAGVLVIAAARDEVPEPAQWLTAGACVELGGLSPGDAEELARQLAGAADAGAIAREATGHPLHIAELALQWHRDGNPAPRLDDAIAARVHDLPVDHARVLELVVIGGALPQAVIDEAAGMDGGACWTALGALRGASLVRTHGPRGTDVVEPYHDRVRETVANRLAPGVVLDGHTRLAAALEARGLGDERPDLLAYHLEGAERPAEAARWTERAADQAARALAFDRAADLYTRALALTSRPQDHQVSLYTRLGAALGDGGRGAPAADAYLAAAALVTGDAAQDLRRRAAEQLMRSGHLDDGLVVLDKVLGEIGLPAVQRRWPLVSLLVERARLRIRRWRGPAHRDATDLDRMRMACCWTTVIGVAMASPVLMAEYQTRHLRLALTASEPRRIALSLSSEAAASALGGPPALRAHALLAEARTWAAQVDDRFAPAFISLAEGSVAMLCGKWRDALARADAAEYALRNECVGAAWEIGTATQLSLLALFHLGHIAELRRRFARALDDADRRGDLYASTELRTAVEPIVCLMDDRIEDARAALARSEQGLPQREVTMQHWQHMQSSVLVELYAGAPGRAVELLERKMPAIWSAFLMRIYAVRAFNTYLHLTAWLGLLGAGAPDPGRLAARIRKLCRRLDGDLPMRAVPLLAGAGLAVVRGDLDAAVTGYREAAEGFDALDMMQLASSARWRLGELIGGHAGRALIADARAALAAEGVVRPDRLVAAFAPITAGTRRPGTE